MLSRSEASLVFIALRTSGRGVIRVEVFRVAAPRQLLRQGWAWERASIPRVARSACGLRAWPLRGSALVPAPAWLLRGSALVPAPAWALLLALRRWARGAQLRRADPSLWWRRLAPRWC